MSLRISVPSPNGRARRGPGGEQYEGDNYMSRLIKLIPAEAVAVYPLLQNRALDVVSDIHRSTKPAQSSAPAATGATSTPAAPNVFHGTTPTTTPTAPATPVEAAANITPQSEFYDPVPLITDHWLPIAMAWIVLILVIMIRWQATRAPGGDAQWGAVAIAAISFFLWVPAIDGSFGILEIAHVTNLIDWEPAVRAFVPELLLILWTFLIPVFYKPQN